MNRRTNQSWWLRAGTRGAWMVALVTLAGGCASLDPAPEIDRAASTVAQRAGLTPAWNVPWEVSLEAWDGRSPLTVDRAVALALRNNRAIRARVESIGASRADLVQAGLLPNPVLALTLRFPADPATGGTFVGASAVQSLTALWLRGGRIKAAEARLNQTVLEVSDAALSLVAEVKATHTRLVYGSHALSLADENLATIGQTIASLEARVRGGEGTPLDANRARQQLAKAQVERAMLARDLAADERRLLALIGFAGERTGWAAEPGPETTSDAPIEEASVVALAHTQRLDVAAARAAVEAQREDLSVEEQARLGDVGLGADFERTETGEKSVGPVVEIGVPIFDANQAQIAKAGSLARAALAAYEATVQNAVREARTAWIAYDSATRLVTQYRDEVRPLAARNLALATAALHAGQADVTVLLEAQREQVEARLILNNLERDAALARITLEQSVGGAIPRSEQ